MKTYNCGHCGIECKWRHQGNNKFCSIECSAKNKTKVAQEEFWAGNKPNIFRDVARRFIAERRGYNCEVCSISEWAGKALTLHVDHINGDPSNNHPTNLRLICPNCHSQTSFLGGANKGRGRGSLGLKH
jgi:5-methylcytosine-specific restriction endonuclease McrA